MKCLFLLTFLISPSVLFAEVNLRNPVEIALGEEESFQVYEQLQVPTEVEAGGKRLVRRGQNVSCSRSSYYPGDFEYNCTIQLLVTGQGVTLPH